MNLFLLKTMFENVFNIPEKKVITKKQIKFEMRCQSEHTLVDGISSFHTHTHKHTKA